MRLSICNNNIWGLANFQESLAGNKYLPIGLGKTKPLIPRQAPKSALPSHSGASENRMARTWNTLMHRRNAILIVLLLTSNHTSQALADDGHATLTQETELLHNDTGPHRDPPRSSVPGPHRDPPRSSVPAAIGPIDSAAAAAAATTDEYIRSLKLKPLSVRASTGGDRLPRPMHASESMLVMINAYNWNIKSHLPNTLETLLALRDRGIDVHIAIYTATPGMEDVLFDGGQRYFSTRLWRSMPILVLTFDRDVKLGLAAVHRDLVVQELDDYDYFMYLEDDLALKVHHFLYLKHWTDRLLPHRMLPGLLRYEVSPIVSPALSNESGRNAIIMDEHPYPATVFQHDGVHLLQSDNPYMAMWFLPREVLRPLTSRPDWHTHVWSKPHQSLRIESATLWLKPFFRIVTPVRHLEQALIHHVSTHYSGEFGNHELFNFDALDWFDDLRACLGTSMRTLKRAPHARFCALTPELQGACARCLSTGDVAEVRLLERKAPRWQLLTKLHVRCRPGGH